MRVLVREPDGSFTDFETGETVTAEKLTRYLQDAAFYFGYQMYLQEFALDRDLRGVAKDVMLFLISKMRYDNVVYIRQSKLCEQFKVGKQHMSTIIRRLKEKGLIFQIGKVGRSPYYRVHHELCWKGSAEDKFEYLKGYGKRRPPMLRLNQ